MLHELYLRDVLIINIVIILSLFFILIFAKKLPKKLVNTVFTFLISIFYIIFVIAAYRFWKAGKSEPWLFYNVLPTANISPLMFFLITISVFLPKKFKNWVYFMISILGIAFLIAGELLAIMYCLNLGGTNYIYFNSIDVFNHLLFFLFAVYLIKSDQIELTFNNLLKNVCYIFVYIFVLIIINTFCNTSFFGLCFSSEYNIYRMKIVPNAYLSAFIYILGLIIVLLSGYFISKLTRYIQYKLANKYKSKINEGSIIDGY